MVYQYPLTVQLYRGWAFDARTVYPKYDPYPFVVRTITRREFKNWKLACPQPVLFEDQILREAVITHPETFEGRPWVWDDLPAGLPSMVVSEILRLSGFSEEGPSPLIMERVQEYVNSDEAKYDQLVLVATDAYKLEELQDMHPEEYHALIAQVQWKLTLLGFDPDIILDPDAYNTRERLAQQQAMVEQQQAQMAGMRPGRSRVVPEGQMTIVNNHAAPAVLPERPLAPDTMR